MSDLISRADAIEAMDERWGDIKRTNKRVAKGHEAVYLDMRATVSALPSADAEWISCSERLPKKGEVVLITNGKGNVRCGQYRSEHDVRGGAHYWWWKGKTVETVLAWMPLPKPYREDGEDDGED